MKNNLLLCITLVLTFSSCTKKETKETVREWKLEYKNDAYGNKLFGNKEALISYIRQGYPVRIGWASQRRKDSTKSVEHTVDAEFITIANGNDVFAQITPFLAQRPDLRSDTLSITLIPTKIHWVLGTNGLISRAEINHSKDTVSTVAPKSFKHNISWFVKASNSSKKAKPLWE